MTETKIRIQMARTTCSDADSYIALKITDDTTGKIILKADIPLSEFAMCITGKEIGDIIARIEK